MPTRPTVPGRPPARQALEPSTPAWSGPLACEPMLAWQAERPFSHRDWLFEVKLDGFRLHVARDGDDVRLRYRSGRTPDAAFPELVEAARALPASGFLLDGELVVPGADGRPSFERLQSRAFGRARGSRVEVHAFDLLALDGRDLRALPLRERKRRLRDLLAGAPPAIRYVDHVEAEGEALFREVSARRLEGVMAKRADSPYRPGRSRDWLKLKVRERATFVVIGLADVSDDTFGMVGALLGEPGPGGVRYAGRVGLPRPEAEALGKVLSTLGRDAPCCSAERRGVRAWLEPLVRCEVAFTSRTERGRLREPSFVRFLLERD